MDNDEPLRVRLWLQGGTDQVEKLRVASGSWKVYTLFVFSGPPQQESQLQDKNPVDDTCSTRVIAIKSHRYSRRGGAPAGQRLGYVLLVMLFRYLRIGGHRGVVRGSWRLRRQEEGLREAARSVPLFGVWGLFKRRRGRQRGRSPTRLFKEVQDSSASCARNEQRATHDAHADSRVLEAAFGTSTLGKIASDEFLLKLIKVSSFQGGISKSYRS